MKEETKTSYLQFLKKMDSRMSYTEIKRLAIKHYATHSNVTLNVLPWLEENGYIMHLPYRDYVKTAKGNQYGQ